MCLPTPPPGSVKSACSDLGSESGPVRVARVGTAHTAERAAKPHSSRTRGWRRLGCAGRDDPRCRPDLGNGPPSVEHDHSCNAGHRRCPQEPVGPRRISAPPPGHTPRPQAPAPSCAAPTPREMRGARRSQGPVTWGFGQAGDVGIRVPRSQQGDRWATREANLHSSPTATPPANCPIASTTRETKETPFV